MELVADMSWVTQIVLVSLRLSALLLLTPIFASARMPVRIRVLWVIGLAVVLVSALPLQADLEPLTTAGFIRAAFYELFLGGLLAFGLFTAFAAFLFGGRILDFQMGFGVANLIDPVTNTQNPLIGSVLNMMAVATFFLLNGHHYLIRGIAYSLERVPPGTALHDFHLGPVVAQFGLMFSFGLALVAPAVIALLLVDVGMAFAARTMPQVNMFIVGLPLKIFVGLAMLALSLRYMSPLLQRIYESIFRYWEQVLE